MAYVLAFVTRHFVPGMRDDGATGSGSQSCPQIRGGRGGDEGVPVKAQWHILFFRQNEKLTKRGHRIP